MELIIKNSWDDLTIKDLLSLENDASPTNYMRVLTNLTDEQINNVSKEDKEMIEKKIAFTLTPPFYSGYNSFLYVNGIKYNINQFDNFSFIDMANMESYLTDMKEYIIDIWNILYKPEIKDTPKENILDAKLKDVYGYYLFFYLVGSNIQKIIHSSLENLQNKVKMEAQIQMN